MRHSVLISAYPGLVPPQEITLPVSLEEYDELWRSLERDREAKHLELWKAKMRIWSAGDHFFRLRYLMMAGREAWNSERNEPHFHHPVHIKIARRIQFDEADDAVLIGARTIGKSTHLFCDDLGHKLVDEDDASTWFSLSRELAQKKGGSHQKEMEENALLVGIWDDRFWQNAEERPASTKWSLRDGLCIKRKSTRPEQSFEYHAFEKRLPTGTHPDGRYYDDIEAEGSAESPDVAATIESRWVSSQRLHSDKPRRRVTGTYYHPHGMMMRLSGPEYGLAAWVYPGEDLEQPESDPSLAGPLGGTPTNGFTREACWRELAASGGARRVDDLDTSLDELRPLGDAEEQQEAVEGRWRRTSNRIALVDYARQIACNATAGSSAKLDWSLIRRYTHDDLMKIRRRSTAVICLDPSKGIDDPSYLWAWLLTPYRDFYWVDGERRIVSPKARCLMTFQMCSKWQGIAQQTQLRIENFGNSEAYERQMEYHQELGFLIPTINCHDTRKSKIARAFERWQPAAADGRIVFPEMMIREDENGRSIDLVASFKADEWDPFPQPKTDHGLDSGGLIWEEEARVGPLPWPTPRRERPPVHSDAGYASAGVL